MGAPFGCPSRRRELQVVGDRPDTQVTDRTGHVGHTFSPFEGGSGCLGRSVSVTDERLQFVAWRLAVNYKIIRQRRETGSVKQDVRSPFAIVIQLYGHSYA